MSAATRTSRPQSRRYFSAVGKFGRAVQMHGPDSPEATAARVERDVVGIEERLSDLIDSAPAPTPEQISRLRSLLPEARG